MPNSSSSSSTFNEIVIDTANSGDFDQFFTIYEEALPTGERKPRSVIEKLIDRPDYRILCLKDANEVVAFAIVFTSVTREVGLLEYMAKKKPCATQDWAPGFSVWRWPACITASCWWKSIPSVKRQLIGAFVFAERISTFVLAVSRFPALVMSCLR
jgi:hypothetical protein